MYALRYREELPPSVVKELDDFISFLQHYLGVSLNEDGTIRFASPVKGTIAPGGDSTTFIRNFLGTAGATDGHVAIYDAATGSLKDSGQNLEIISTTFTITSTAMYLAMNTAPQIVIPTPGPLKSIDVIGWSMEENIKLNGGSAFSSGPTFGLRFSGGTTDLSGGHTVSNPASGSRYLRFNIRAATGVTLVNDESSANRAVILRTAADISGGSLATVNFTFKIYYALRTVMQ